MCEYLIFFIVFIFSIIISIIDFKFYKIPNTILILYFISCLIIFICFECNTLLIRFISGILLFLVFLFIYFYTKGMGLGDVKYSFVIGFVLGFKSLYACLIGTIIALIFSISTRTKKIAYGPFLALGCIVVFVINIFLTPKNLSSLILFMKRA